ncbi:protein NRT1/ PTR FAMILY 8.2 [Selaginella moellendorffii]|uniref:protein NRT1/ PTR FAMILY 8.2 n=1 Tax=Selaginella moellendorffii TaxID=88036 RepID=UPI000D1C3E88|nr:protein NRT1/ PTR FAMILY 8.2 [Selaginella moellendorffii]|eukprot:XP_024535895.1 protein NRT1/ PTR FAMILY 8.2 [Selaginella moellendorffii]
MAFTTFATSFVSYLMDVMHKSPLEASTIITVFFGVCGTTPLLGGFLADAYLGRYATIAIFSIVHLLGLILLAAGAVVAPLSPRICKHDAEQCLDEKATAFQMGYLYVSLLIVAIGFGGIKSNIVVFGADQFDRGNPSDKKNLGMFFSSLYMTLDLGFVLALTIVVYIQVQFGWNWGLTTLAIAMAAGNALFFAGTPFYKQKRPSGSPVTRLLQVIVSAYRKRKLELPQDVNLLYEVPGRMSAIPGSSKIQHTDGLRFLDKAAVKIGLDHEVEGSWTLCTVTQVEELKAMIRLLPICATTMLLMSTVVVLLNYSTVQALMMDRSLSKSIQVPAPSVPFLSSVFVMIAIPFYELVYVPAMQKLTGNPRGTTHLQRIGIGLFLSTLTMIVAGFVEHKRAESKRARFSAFLLTIQFSMYGLASIFGTIGLIELFYSQAPEGMRCFGSSLLPFTAAIGSFLASALNSIVGSSTNWLHQSWQWHLDYYYWLLACLNAVNFALFLVCARFYTYKEEQDKERDGETC